MNFLLTNDDGIDAPGLAALREAVAGLTAGRVAIAAPAGPMSECGHTVTTGKPIRTERLGENEIAVHGSPADCARVVLRGEVFPDFVPDWVLSGVNRGGNLGVDIYYSGTVAAAREAAILGARSMAISHYVRKELEIDWAAATRRAISVMTQLMEAPLAAGEFWNINLPHLDAGAAEPEALQCERSRKPLPVKFESGENTLNYAGLYAGREFEPGSDVAECFGGKIAVSKMTI